MKTKPTTRTTVTTKANAMQPSRRKKQLHPTEDDLPADPKQRLDMGIGVSLPRPIIALRCYRWTMQTSVHDQSEPSIAPIAFTSTGELPVAGRVPFTAKMLLFKTGEDRGSGREINHLEAVRTWMNTHQQRDLEVVFYDGIGNQQMLIKYGRARVTRVVIDPLAYCSKNVATATVTFEYDDVTVTYPKHPQTETDLRPVKTEPAPSKRRRKRQP